VKCPKEDALKDLIDQHEDVGRIAIYAGFTGSIERCMRIVSEMKWDFIKADGRGWHTSVPHIRSGKEMLAMFQDRSSMRKDNIAFVGQPGAAGMGLNLTASPSIVFYSNDFNGESRIQTIDRIHRPGMDINRGATIYDLIHLPTDLYVLENLDRKIKLQGITLGRMVEELKHVTVRMR
jgi:SNF2 family DNA or RNA helicase